MKRAPLMVLLACVALTPGCTASFFLVGAQMHKAGPPAAAEGTYKVTTCTNIADGSTLAGPVGQTYYLTRSGGAPALYELDASGEGAKIINHWADEEGDHFFTYVKTHGAWEYVFPADSSKAPVRRAFAKNGNWSTQKTAEGIIKPTGEPGFRCPMVKQ